MNNNKKIKYILDILNLIILILMIYTFDKNIINITTIFLIILYFVGRKSKSKK